MPKTKNRYINLREDIDKAGCVIAMDEMRQELEEQHEKVIKKLEQEKDKEIAVNRSEVYDEMNKQLIQIQTKLKEVDKIFEDMDMTLTTIQGTPTILFNDYVKFKKKLKNQLRG